MSELLESCRRIATQAADLAMRLRTDGVQVAATKSSATDVVTRADRATEEWIRAEIAALRPDDGFFGEESQASASKSGLTWVVDPIDGTVNYLYDIPQYAVSIAVVEGEPKPDRWRTLVGCVVVPRLGEIYSAETGRGAWLGEDRLQVNAPANLATSLIGTGFGYGEALRRRQAEILASLIGEVRDIRRSGSAAVDLCSVAAGRLDAYYETGLNPWDHAAGALIARESGALVSGGPGRIESRELLIAVAPGIEAAFIGALERAGALPI